MKSGELGKTFGIIFGVDLESTYSSSSYLHDVGHLRSRLNLSGVPTPDV